MIVNPDIEQYINALLPARDPVLAEMEAFAAEHKVPIVGPAVASLLAQLVMISGAKRIFELGSAIGYSTLWLARAAGEGAEVHYTDGDEGKAKQARQYFERAGVADRVPIHVGDALGSLAATPGKFDFIFNDIDKQGYPAACEAVPLRLRSGGLFVTDNTLWRGKVVDPQDETSQIVADFNTKVFQNKDLFSVLIPLRDGVLVAVKR